MITEVRQAFLRSLFGNYQTVQQVGAVCLELIEQVRAGVGYKLKDPCLA
jgi:hypothetical protein